MTGVNGVNNSAANESYSYDSDGNRVSSSAGSTTDGGYVTGANNPLVSDGTSSHRNPLDDIPRDLLLPAVVEPRRAGVGVTQEILHIFKSSAKRPLGYRGVRALSGKLGSRSQHCWSWHGGASSGAGKLMEESHAKSRRQRPRG